jgi:hypothetical protein
MGKRRDLVPITLTELKKRLKTVRWSRLKPGMIYLGGIQIDGVPPEELKEFPRLTNDLLNTLQRRYSFIHNRNVLVFDSGTDGDYSVREILDEMAEQKGRVDSINRFRRRFFESRKEAPNLPPLILPSSLVDREFLQLNRFNSITLPKTRYIVPTFLGEGSAEITMEHILSTDRFAPLRVPDDRPVHLHVGIDCSYSMVNDDKQAVIQNTLAGLSDFVSGCLKKTRITLYAFSDECRILDAPYTGREVANRGTRFTAFFDSVMKNRSWLFRYNKCLLLTDGNPEDLEEACTAAGDFRSQKIDFTQVIFNFADSFKYILPEETKAETLDRIATVYEEDAKKTSARERREIHDNIKARFALITAAAGGNHIHLMTDRVMGHVSVEEYDTYAGHLSLFGED